jgi:hypothetical protein
MNHFLFYGSITALLDWTEAKHRKISQDSGLKAEIWTWDLQNTKQEY